MGNLAGFDRLGLDQLQISTGVIWLDLTDKRSAMILQLVLDVNCHDLIGKKLALFLRFAVKLQLILDLQ